MVALHLKYSGSMFYKSVTFTQLDLLLKDCITDSIQCLVFRSAKIVMVTRGYFHATLFHGNGRHTLPVHHIKQFTYHIILTFASDHFYNSYINYRYETRYISRVLPLNILTKPKYDIVSSFQCQLSVFEHDKEAIRDQTEIQINKLLLGSDRRKSHEMDCVGWD